jgi:cytochrome b561
MLLKNTLSSYGWISIILHWFSSLVILALFALGWWMVDLDYYSAWYTDAPHYHKSVGLLLATLTLLRLGWKISQVSPQGIGKMWEKNAAKLAHFILYISLISLFLTGYLISTADGRGIDIFNWLTLPSMGKWFDNQEDIAGDIHEYLAYVLIAIVVIHAAAAGKHHFINKDSTLKRMLKPLTHNKDPL